MIRPRFAIVAGAALTAAAAANVPEYAEFQIQARSNFTGAFNLPDAAFFSNSTPGFNDARQVAIDIGVIAGSDADAIWFGQNGSGGIVHTTDEGAFTSDVSLNDAGIATWAQTFSDRPGLWTYDAGAGLASFLTNDPLGSTGWDGLDINQSGQIGYRVDFGFTGQAWASYDPATDTTAIHAAESGVDPDEPYSFLFTPSFNDSRLIAGKAWLEGFSGNDPAAIIVVDADGNATTIAVTNDVDPDSPFDRFDNSIGFNDGGDVAFIATLVGGGRGVYRSDGRGFVEIANTNTDPELSDVEFFAPDLNDSGWVVFRGVDADGLQALFVGDGVELSRVIGEHDLIETDLGTGRIDQHDDSPVFSGGPRINDFGDLAFAATLTPADDDQVEWGTGLFVATADTLRLTMSDLHPGEVASLGVSNATPGGRVYFAYSLRGLGATPVPPLDVAIDLATPRLLGSVPADGAGEAELARRIPDVGLPIRVWTQAAQNGRIANVRTDVIE